MQKVKGGLEVIFDSNFLFLPAKFRLDPFEELEKIVGRKIDPIILSVSLHEVREIAERGSPKRRREARFALELAERCKILEVERDPEKSTDEVILRVASEKRIPVATNDKELRKRLKEINVPVIFLRGRGHLEVYGLI